MVLKLLGSDGARAFAWKEKMIRVAGARHKCPLFVSRPLPSLCRTQMFLNLWPTQGRAPKLRSYKHPTIKSLYSYFWGVLQDPSRFLPHNYTSLHESSDFLHGFYKKNRLLCVRETGSESAAPYPGCSPREQLPLRGLNFVKQIELR